MSGENDGDQEAFLSPSDLDTLWDFNDPGGSEARFRAQLSAANRTLGDRVVLLTQVARAQGLQRDRISPPPTPPSPVTLA